MAKWLAKKNKNRRPLAHTSSLTQTWIYSYRFDIFALTVMASVMLFFLEPLFRPGQIVFSDIDFPFNSATYLNEIFGIWNTKWNTTAMLNIPRLIVLLPSFIISKLAGDNGNLFLKAFVVQNLFAAGFSFYLFSKRLVSVNINHHFTMSKIFVIVLGGILYALNPWVIFRIQHIYLLVGYSLFPLVLLMFFKVFDHKFQDAAIENYDPFSKKLYANNKRDMIILAYTITVSSAAIHYFFFIAIILLVLLSLLILKYLIKYRKSSKTERMNILIVFFKKILFLGAIFLGFSFYWLFIYVGSIIFGVQASQNNVNVVDTYVAFSRHSSLKNVLYMISYWWPMVNMKELPLGFYIGGGVVLVTSFIGLVFNIFKQHIILFFSLLTGLLIVFSTGVKYAYFAKIFLVIVKLPIIGSIFRDPNKLVGLLALCIGIFFVFGMETLLSKLTDVLNNKYISIALVVGLSSVALLSYILPMKGLYFEQFYEPVEQPQDYKELGAYFMKDQDYYGIYLPLSDEMTRPYVNVSTPYWNINRSTNQAVTKATGDVQVYNSPIDTLFQFEGNDPTIAYYFSYIQYLIDEGRSNSIKKSIEAFGANQLIYHDEYIAHESRQDFNKEVIELDKTLDKTYENDIFSVYDLGMSLENRNELNSIARQAIMTPYGFERTSIYEKLGIYKPLHSPVMYMNQYALNKQIDLSDGFSESIIEVRDEKDIVLSQIPDRYYHYPFEWTNQGNVFLGWSKTNLSSIDWKWFLKSQDITNRAFEFDRGKGMAVTFASKRLAVEPYLRDQVKGMLTLDFDTMLRTDNFFVPDNPDLFEVNSNPYFDQKNVQTLRGELVKGDSNDIWQVAKSGMLEAKADTPYFFEFVLSGRDVDKLHLKVRFYDEMNEEIGISYVVAANEASYFDTIRFTGEVISPPNAKHMRIDLLSYQNTIFKSFWWIHEVNVYDLTEYVEENSIKSEILVDESGEYDVFMRAFNSKKGGLLELKVEDQLFEVLTKDQSINSLRWHKLGSIKLEKGNVPVELLGRGGFNAVNSIVIVPKAAYSLIKQDLSKKIENKGILMTFEGSLDLAYQGNMQTNRIYPSLSLGKGIALKDGTLQGEFDVLLDDVYHFNTLIKYVNSIDGYGKLKIFKENALVKEWELKDRNPTNSQESIVEHAPENIDYAHYFIDLQTPYQYESSQIPSLKLDKGHYTFQIDLHSEIENLSAVDTIRPFDTSQISFEMAEVDPDFVESCERITEDMMRAFVDGESILISLDPTCSTDWYSYATNRINVEASEEYLIRYKAKSEHLLNRHSKVLFLDESNYVVDVVYINEIEAQYKANWNDYEQLVKVPQGAKTMIIQFLGNGDRDLYSTLEIENFEVYNYNDFILLDHFVIFNERANNLSKQGHVTHSPTKSLEAEMSVTNNVKRSLNQFGLKYILDAPVEGKSILNTFLSPNKNWQKDGISSSYILNGLTQGYPLDGTNEYVFKLLLMPVYLVGLGLHIITLCICVYMVVVDWRRARRPTVKN